MLKGFLDRSSSVCAMTSTYPVLQGRWILEHFFTHLFLNMVPCWEGTYPAEGREKATSLPSVFSDSERATTSTTPGVHGVQGQWPPWDFLSPLTSTCLQTP